VRCVRVAGFVNSVPEFTGQSQVLDGASNLFVDVFGDAGRHTRMAVGVSALPYDVAVEVEAVLELRRNE
jgi:enamine deaminase RidA (YjgF/YER057c/UK114 family)